MLPPSPSLPPTSISPSFPPSLPPSIHTIVKDWGSVCQASLPVFPAPLDFLECKTPCLLSTQVTSTHICRMGHIAQPWAPPADPLLSAHRLRGPGRNSVSPSSAATAI